MLMRMDWLFVTDDAIIEELRERCRRERLVQNLTQADVAERAGLGTATVSRFERDRDYSPSLETFVRILRVLGALDTLEQILPPRPLDPLNPAAGDRLRARPAAPDVAEGEWTWGDQQ